ncbi:hypothetical protein BDZ90DRAFT_234911 [Jaminaea rosea]|uniref:Phosphoglycerate mutase-like protein n=1 Tax=Jaminaea rosea TaxID=1569628 RepID=A0A316UH38_9BASI|nr:hypothetical protein BDZ90DRAFT_234911 [Jaminaea rosea]PWN24637.1 hypothetical protein BDZ90DRAFT_234911 [Jaminaea rosea]
MLAFISIAFIAISALIGQLLLAEGDTSIGERLLEWVSLFQSSPWEDIDSDAQTLPLDLSGSTPSALPLNSTLGFSKIYVRHASPYDNRRDELAMMSAVSNLSVAYSDKPLWNAGTNVSLAGLPWHDSLLSKEELAEYRSHATVWRRILDEQTPSALILSDTVDWDINVHAQLQRLQTPLATLISAYEQQQSSNAHGDPRKPSRQDPLLSNAWDILFLGCEEELPLPMAVDLAPFARYDDESVAPSSTSSPTFVELLAHYGMSLEWAMAIPGGAYEVVPGRRRGPPRQRLVAVAQSPRCSTAYAISRRGAAKLLHTISRGLEKPVHDMVADLTQSRQLRAFVTLPPLMGEWVQDTSEDNVRRDPSLGRADNVRDSVRQHLKRLIWEM